MVEDILTYVNTFGYMLRLSIHTAVISRYGR